MTQKHTHKGTKFTPKCTSGYPITKIQNRNASTFSFLTRKSGNKKG